MVEINLSSLEGLVMGITPFRKLPPMTMRDATRFWSKVEQLGPDECWPWRSSSRTDHGYGMFSISFATEYGTATGLFNATRVAYALIHGSTPPDLEILHSCDHPWCVNPQHLRAGTKFENAADKVARGRHPRGGRVPNVALPRQLLPLPTRSGERHTFAKLTARQVANLRERYARDESITAYALAREVGVSVQNMIFVITGRTWKSAGGPISVIRPIIGARVPGAKLTDLDIAEIRRRYAPRGINGDSGRTLAKEFGVVFQTISDIVRGKDWKHVP